VADAQRSGRSLREVAVASGAVTPEEADDLLDVDRLAHPWSDR
jgi:fumarate hydratase class II